MYLQVRASLRVINPKEIKYLKEDEKLDRHTFARNLSRAKAVLAWVLYAFRVVKWVENEFSMEKKLKYYNKFILHNIFAQLIYSNL